MSVVTILSFLTIGCLAVEGFVARAPIPDSRIVGGLPTSILSHPHQASLQLYGSHYCGASLISNKWVITAGHCVGSSASAYNVSVGSTSKYFGTKYPVKRIVRHPQYDDFTIDYDIALVELNRNVTMSSFVKPIKLASVELPANSTVVVTGWGATTEGGSSPSLLQQVSVPIVNRTLCAKAYADVNPITPRMICAGLLGQGGKDSCQGDSGGPLTANKILYGTVSWGFGCAQPKYPGVYGNVVSMRSWIRNVTGI